MPFLENANHTNISHSTLADIGRDFNLLIQHGDPLTQILYQATATGAAYNSQERNPPPRCQPGTRKVILGRITHWLEGEATSRNGSIMWLHGPAGAGKSAIAQTVCESAAKQGQLAASFFFSRGNGRRGKVDSFIPTIAFQLASSGNESLLEQVAQAVKEDMLILHGATTAQVEPLIVRPLQSFFRDMTQTRNVSPFLIVVDGLDECSGNTHQTELLTALMDLVLVHHLPLHILIVSRPEPHIKHKFDTAMRNTNECCAVSLYGDHKAYQDVRSFLKQGFRDIHDSERHSATMNAIPKPWPSGSIITNIANKSGGYFIYASTILKFVDEEYYSPIERLEQVTDGSLTPESSAFAELDKLYTQILGTSPKRDSLKRILACILMARERISKETSTSGIETLLGLHIGEVMLHLRGLHSLLSFFIKDGTIFVRSVHASFADFLFDKERAGKYSLDVQEHHKDVAIGCWRYFSGPSINIACERLKVRARDSNAMHIQMPDIKDYLRLFRYHFPRIKDKTQVLDDLKSANSTTWAPLIAVSRNWTIADKQILSMTVYHTTVELEALVPLPKDFLDELNSLADQIHREHLFPRSVEDIRLVQGIFTMFAPPAIEVTGYNEFLGVPQAPERHWEYITKYLTNVMPKPGCKRADETVQFCHHPSFTRFMSNPTRCGNLFADAGSRHARLALCCIKELTTRMSGLHGVTKNRSFRSYGAIFFAEHLAHASPSAVDEVQTYLRNLNLTATFTELAHTSSKIKSRLKISAILNWLESLPEPPADIIIPWAEFYNTVFSPWSPGIDDPFGRKRGYKYDQEHLAIRFPWEPGPGRNYIF